MDQYGATPETTLEMLFDTLIDAPDFLIHAVGGGKPEWKDFIAGLRQLKAEKKQAKRVAHKKTKLAEETDTAAGDDDLSQLAP